MIFIIIIIVIHVHTCVHTYILCHRLVVKSITRPSIDHWRPLVVMANPKSGGKDGEFVLSSFRKLLNPIQVIDLSETPPENGLEICRMLEELHCRVLVCGGDGTVGWVLSTLDKLQLPVRYDYYS